MTEDEMAGWHHWLDGHEFERTPGVGDGQGSLACCDSWGCKESDTTELNWPSYWGFSFALGCGVSFLVGSNILSSMAIQQWVVILKFSQVKIYTLLLLLLNCFSRVRLFVTPWTAAYQAPPPIGFSRQESWDIYTTIYKIFKQKGPTV